MRTILFWQLFWQSFFYKEKIAKSSAKISAFQGVSASISVLSFPIPVLVSSRTDDMYFIYRLQNVVLNIPRLLQSYTTEKMKFFIKDFFSKCDQIRRKMGIWSHLLKKSLIENFILCVVLQLLGMIL